MAILSVQKILPAGTLSTLAAAAGGGDSFPNTGHEYLEVANGDASAKTVTIAAQANCGYGVDSNDHDVVLSVAAGTRRKFGPFPPDKFNDANGRVQVTYSAVTSVTVGAFALGAA